MIATDPEGRVTTWSKGAEYILGWSEQDMLGQTVERIFTPEDRAAGRAAEEMHLALTEGAGNDERWHNDKSGRRFWASGEMTPLCTDDGDVIGFVKVLRDRTEQRLAIDLSREKEPALQRGPSDDQECVDDNRDHDDRHAVTYCLRVG